MNITSNGRSIADVLTGKYLLVPRFQRPYEWDAGNVEDFWSDVSDSGSDYFIGSMVVFPSTHGTQGVVDGQQRVTTITLLLCALRDALREVHADDAADGLQNLIERRGILDNQQHYVLQTDVLSPYLKHVQSGKSGAAPKAPEGERLLRAAHLYLRGQVGALVAAAADDAARKKQLLKLREKVLGLRLVLIEVDNEYDATVIFQTLNSRGRDLEVADLVKSHVLSLLSTKNPANDPARDEWNGMLDSLAKSQADLPMDRFLLHSWLSGHDYVGHKDLFKPIRRHVTKDNAAEFLQELVTDARLYREVHEPTYRAPWQQEERPIQNAFAAIQLFRVRQPLPWLLSLWRAYDAGHLKQKDVIPAVQAVERFVFLATAVTNQPSSGGVSRMYASHARQLRDASTPESRRTVIASMRDKLSSRVPSYAEFAAALAEVRFSRVYSQQQRLATYVLRGLHAHDTTKAPVDVTQLTVEHIAPQGKARPSHFEESDVARLGNLLLVPKDLNERLGDKPFEAKQQLLKQASTEGLWVDPYVLNAPEWTTTQIEDRNASMAKQAYDEVWSLPSPKS